VAALAPHEGFLVRAPVERGLHGVTSAGDMNGDGGTDLLAGAVYLFSSP
jgi:hypothetical protein